MNDDHKTRVCVPLSETTIAALASSCREAIDVADLIELRLDYLDQNELSHSEIETLIEKCPKPVILTFRPDDQGGYRSISDKERFEFWKWAFTSEAAFFDVEVELAEELAKGNTGVLPDWSRVICSQHDFTSAKPVVELMYERIASTPARIIKIAVQSNDVVDCLDLFKLLDRSRVEQRPIIAIGMGSPGVLTRIVGPSRGSFLTYAALGSGKGTAPGQINAVDLNSIYRIGEIKKETMVTGLIGSPVMHSVSPHMHNAAFHSTNVSGVYIPLEVKNLHVFIKRMVNLGSREFDWNLRGFSVTAPHKVEILNLLDWVEPRAHSIGAVNTVVVENERLLGYNTDCDGFLEPLRKRISDLRGTRVAVLGAGGAANAVVYSLCEQKADVVLFARNEVRAQDLCKRFNISYYSLNDANFSHFDVVVNTTPLGSSGQYEKESPANSSQLSGCRFVYDLVYNPIETKLMREARTANCEVLGGLEMLVGQAVRQFKLWTSTDVSYELMYNAASRALTHSSQT